MMEALNLLTSKTYLAILYLNLNTKPSTGTYLLMPKLDKRLVVSIFMMFMANK